MAGPPFFPVVMHSFVSCVVSFRVTCSLFSILLLISFFLFYISIPVQNKPQRSVLHQSLVPCNFLFLIWLSLPVINPIIGPFIFRNLLFLYTVVAPGVVLCARCILSCKNYRLLQSCCIKWVFSYLVRWLTYIWATVLLGLTYVIKVVQYLFSFQTSLPYFESG